MKLFKKMISTLAALLVVVSMFAFAAFAATTGTVRVSTSSYLNVRSAASSTAPIIGRLSNGTQVSILGSSNGWYQISYNGQSAWVYGQYITVSTDKAQIVVNAANSAIGVRYVYGGATLNGMDCSGLVVYSYAKAGITLPHSSSQQSTLGVAVSRTNLKPGDLVFFDTDGGLNNINHVGIYIGNNNFISAQSGAGYVKVASLTNTYWSSRYMTARRIINA
jgi:N-acetylmuramoyl-L-alanine amidase